MSSLSGKVAIVTGSGKNIGRAIAMQLADAGCQVVVNGRYDASAVQEVTQAITDAGGHAIGVMADISKEADVESLVTQCLRAFGRLDIVVSNAGLRRQTPFVEMSFAEWREILSVALDGAFLLARAATPHLIESGGGSIIALSGVSTHVATANRCHVSASKSGLEGLMRALAIELAPHRITCNAIAPGAIDTVRSASAGVAPNREVDLGIPLGRKGHVDEIASMVRYLAGSEGRYITGQTLHINGGLFLT